MSRIDELEKEIQRHEANIRQGQSIIDSNKPPLESFKAELAALKAESQKPREFEVAMDKYGSIHGVIKPKSELLTIGDGTSPTFTVREVSPIVVTKKMGCIAQETFDAQCYSLKHPFGLVAVLNAIGIEARSGDE